MTSAWVLLRFILAFAAVVAAARLLTGWVGRRYKATGRNLEVVESLGLGPRRALCLVRVGGKHLLLGVTDQSIRLIDTVDRVESATASGSPQWTWKRWRP